jgi:ribose 5-phosphate isomerase B
MADAFLENAFGQGYEEWEGFDEFHVVGYEETDGFDYDAYKANGFKLEDESEPYLAPWPKDLPF